MWRVKATVLPAVRDSKDTAENPQALSHPPQYMESWQTKCYCYIWR